MKRRHFLNTLFAASVMTTAVARRSIEAVVGPTDMPRVVLEVFHVNTCYWCAEFEEVTESVYNEEGLQVRSHSWRGLLSNSGKSTLVGEDKLPRRYNTLEDAEAEVNAVPPYLLERINLLTGEVEGDVSKLSQEGTGRCLDLEDEMPVLYRDVITHEDGRHENVARIQYYVNREEYLRRRDMGQLCMRELPPRD